jgi:hypothetical protein
VRSRSAGLASAEEDAGMLLQPEAVKAATRSALVKKGRIAFFL